jgi:hypothetical protein
LGEGVEREGREGKRNNKILLGSFGRGGESENMSGGFRGHVERATLGDICVKIKETRV